MDTNQQAQDELLNFIDSQSSSFALQQIDRSTLRYVVYARKSTLNEDRQEKSIDDQVKICIDQAEARGLPKPVAIIEESGSAKEPNIRPKFTQMLQDLRDDKIDGIIAWHPDRLARNMKEAGEIIDMLDRFMIKDLQFATSVFDNTPTGKILLGISFVLSKQYSEHLSESVTRGNNRRTEDGIFLGKFKHGYVLQSDGRLFPDDNNFTLIQEAFKMRLENARLEDIANYLNAQGYTKHVKSGEHQEYVWNKQRVSKLMSDPVYCGVLWYGDARAVLSESYSFTPAVEMADFMRINKISDLEKASSGKLVLANRTRHTKRKVQADLWRGMVLCSGCNRAMHSSITVKKDGTRYYYYFCATEGCVFKKVSVKPSVIVTFLQDFFDTYSFTTKSNYEKYVADYMAQVSQARSMCTSEINRLTAKIANEKRGLVETKDVIKHNKEMARYYVEDLKVYEEHIEKWSKDKQDLIMKKDALKESRKTYAEYLELMQKVPVLLGSQPTLEQLDKIGREFFSNFVIYDRGRTSEQRWEIEYKLKEPWEGFLKNDDFSCGRGERTRTFDLTVPNRAR